MKERTLKIGDLVFRKRSAASRSPSTPLDEEVYSEHGLGIVLKTKEDSSGAKEWHEGELRRRMSVDVYWIRGSNKMLAKDRYTISADRLLVIDHEEMEVSGDKWVLVGVSGLGVLDSESIIRLES